MDRKTIKVSKSVKTKITSIKTAYGFKRESEAIAYLIAHFEQNISKISIVDHKRLKELSRDIDNQISF